MDAATVATFAVWGALLGAMAEVAARFVLLKFAPTQGSTFHLNPIAFAVGPLVNLPVFAIVTVFVWLAARALRPPRAFEAVVFAVLALVAFEVALITERVHLAALALLAAGCATVGTRFMNRLPQHGLRLVRVSTVAMILVAASGALILRVRQAGAEKRALDGLPAAPAGAPNVVVLILDTVRAIELGAWGNPRPVSPNLDSLARSAIQFDRAYSTAPWTLPSHATMLSGRYSHELSTGWMSPYNGQYPLLSELLRDKGYATGAFVGNTTYLNRRWGLDRGFVRYEDYQIDLTVLWSTSNLTRFLVNRVNTPSRHRILVNGTSANLIRERFLGWQQSIGERPFFAFLNFFDAHAPYGAPAPFDTLFLGRRPRFYDVDNWEQRDSVQQAELRAGYDQAITWLDSQIGALMADLRQRGVLDRTFIVITSDHGEEFGEHGFSNHGVSLHTTQTHVPLLFILPGAVSAQRVGEYVTLRDLAATIADVTGLPRGSVPGNSFTRYWTPSVAANGEDPDTSPILSEVAGQAKLRSWYPAAHGTMHAIIRGNLRYTARDGGGEWLYDLRRDPLEKTDLSKSEAYADSLRLLRAALSNALGTVGNGARR